MTDPFPGFKRIEVVPSKLEVYQRTDMEFFYKEDYESRQRRQQSQQHVIPDKQKVHEECPPRAPARFYRVVPCSRAILSRGTQL